MRAVIVGAVESTRTALRAVADSRDWSVAAVMTLPPALAARHSDYVDLASDAAAVGARLIPTADSNTPDAVAALAGLAADIVFVIGWSQICRAEFRAAAAERIIGYHPAPLPRLRGRAVLPWTILLGEPITAGTLFWIDEGVDSGPILAQRFFHVDPAETAASLYARHLETLAAMLVEMLPRLAANDAPRLPQDERFATWAAKRVPDDGAIDWRAPAADIACLVRAVGRPYPGAFTRCRKEPLVVWSGRDRNGGGHAAATPGQVVGLDEGIIAVRCGCGGIFEITEWTSPSSRRPALHSRLGR